MTKRGRFHVALLNLSGLVMLVSSLGLAVVRATDTPFTENWQVLRYVSFTIKSQRNSPLTISETTPFCLGPLEWQVNGSSGATSFNETWYLVGAKYSKMIPGHMNDTGFTTNIMIYDGTSDLDGDGIARNYFSSPTYDSQLGTRCEPQGSNFRPFGWAEATYVVPSGEYGTQIIYGSDLDSYVPSYNVGGIQMIPTRWRVTGTLTQ